MSRLIVKNLPNGVTEDRLRNIFSEKGHVTDVQLKYTKNGYFRNFAFIGYKTEEEAQEAIKSFDNTFINTIRIKVETCRNLGDPSKPRAWSKYAEDSSEYQKINAIKQPEKIDDKKKKNKKNKTLKVIPGMKEEDAKLLRELSNDEGFQEFLEAYKNKAQAPKWSDNMSFMLDMYNQQKKKQTGGSKDSSEMKEKTDVTETETTKQLSDMEYLKSKVVERISSEDESNEDDETYAEMPKRQTTSGSKDKDTKSVILKGLPHHVKKKDVIQFLAPVKPTRLHFPENIKGSAYAYFASHKQAQKVLKKHQQFLGGYRIEIIYLGQHDAAENNQKYKSTYPAISTASVPGEEEPIADSGRLFVRNLSYLSTESDLETLFGKYGLLTEVHLPLDSFTKKIKGFAYVTYTIPEHAIKAFTELDGSIFQGRMLHILPAKSKPEEKTISGESSSFKKKKLAEMKSQSGSSHNWNTLFLGSNAVVDIMAEKHQISKSGILTAERNESVAVRIALGETQLVMETRKFLLSNGVSLDAFSQPSAARSKMVILVKNLPSGTIEQELRDIFCRFGDLGRVVLPPNGITAIVEFLQPSEARKAFTNLAYTKFHHIPLYLEWAPTEVFKPEAIIKPKEKKTENVAVEEPISEEKKDSSNITKDESEEEESGDDLSEPGRTIFVKNLNFETSEETIKQVFEKCGKILSVSIAKKHNTSMPGEMLSMGYGFVEYKWKESAQEALKQLQHCKIDEHQVELKLSHRVTQTSVNTVRKNQVKKKQTTSKILVRNIPFQAMKSEVEKLFSVFGEIKTVRLPLKRHEGSGTHRGFGFVDFLNKKHAKRAFEALCHSTHLYGRRLVLEWADTDESLVALRKKTADHYHQGGQAKKRKADLLESLLDANDEDN